MLLRILFRLCSTGILVFYAGQEFCCFYTVQEFCYISAGVDGQVRFFITDSQPPESQDLFAINRETGQITVARPLDYETVPAHELTITARDSAVIPRETSRVFTVHLTVSLQHFNIHLCVGASNMHEALSQLPSPWTKVKAV